MTDPGTADRTYIGPMSPELVEEIIEKVLVKQSSRRLSSHDEHASKTCWCYSEYSPSSVAADCRNDQMLSSQQWVGKPR